MDNMKEFNEYINLMRDDILTEYHLGNNTRNDWPDIVHEHADGSQYVIYHAMAWDLVNMVRKCDGALLSDAEMVIDDVNPDTMSIYAMMSLLAYECIYQQLMLALNDAVEDDE